MPLPDNSIVGFQPSKNAIYGITERGQRVCGWIARDKSRETTAYDSRGIPKDSNNARLNHILHDPALRLLFREFLRYSLCEENLSFYLDVSEFTATYHKAEKVGTFKKSDSVRETLAAAYGKLSVLVSLQVQPILTVRKVFITPSWLPVLLVSLILTTHCATAWPVA